MSLVIGGNDDALFVNFVFYDGNLTNDGRWAYSWDAENRLVQLVANTAVGPQQMIKFEYDSKGRRIHKQVWPNTAGTGSATNDLRFVYDGWNLLAELSTANSAVRTYLWGLDLSSSPQGAGGVGGLLEVVYYGSQPTNCFAAYDGNGNVAALISASGGTNVATYEYGPFGELVRATGPMAKANPFRFSTKYQDDETDLLYYGYRYYSASTGRWISRDPIEERGGKNLYEFVLNYPVGRIDKLGHFSLQDHADLTTLSFTDAMYVLGNPVASPCWDRMRRTLVHANVWQDIWGNFDLRRHYNRDVSDQEDGQKEAADRNYEQYLLGEELRFRLSLSFSPAGIGCWRSLRALGRMMHSWQDFYAHAIRRDGEGGFEPGSPSSAEGWLAWTQGVTGTPQSRSSRSRFWPSSYSLFGGGEHPPTDEPIVHGGAEYLARYNAALDYSRQQLEGHLPIWLERCRCFCP